MTHPLLEVLQEIVGPNQKAAAIDLYPDSTPGNAEANLSKVLSGQRHIPPDLVDYCLQRPQRQLLLNYCNEKAKACPEETRKRAVELMEQGAVMFAEAKAFLERAEMLEELESGRRRPLRVEPRDEGRRTG